MALSALTDSGILGPTNGSMTYAKFNRTSSALTEFCRQIDIIEAFGQTFITFAETKNGTLFEYVQLLGSPSEAEEFIFNVEYKGPKCTHAFFGEVASDDETFNDIVSSGKCSTINFEVFKTQFMEDFTDSESGDSCRYSYAITIKKLNEETSQ